MELIVFFMFVGFVIYIKTVFKEPKKRNRKNNNYKPYVKRTTRNNTLNNKNLYDTFKTKTIYATTTEIAEDFNISAKELNKIFEQLKWATKEGKWWLATELGIRKGAKQEYNIKNKIKFITWNIKIKNNDELIYEIKNNKSKTNIDMNYKENVQKGKEYEKFVANFFINIGYKVKEYGLIHGKKDKGIDLIIMKDKHISLIQCKNWKKDGRKIKHTDLKEFIGNTTAFLENNKKEAEGYEIKRIYVTPHNILDNSAKHFLRENRVVEYINIPMS
ncbi:MAG: hypothetical protein GQ570_02300 [Helicobacteraceae bacterium]|nr:hypothetical protein [Helicobacteraceae bacterium]